MGGEMKTILLLALLGACAGGDDAHDVVDCGSSFPGLPKCERACALVSVAVDANMDGWDDICHSAAVPNCPVDHVGSFEDRRGCCVVDGSATPVVRFHECEGE